MGLKERLEEHKRDLKTLADRYSMDGDIEGLSSIIAKAHELQDILTCLKESEEEKR